MVHGDQQRMFILADPDQPPADQRSGLQIERAARLLFHQIIQFLLPIHALPQVVLHHLESALLDRRNQLRRSPPTSTNVVRSASCRSTIRSNARARAPRSSSPLSRIPHGM